MTYPATDRTTSLRARGRVTYERAAAHAILDEAYHCHLGFTVDGQPRILPTLHVRIDDTLYLHGSTGSRPLLAARGGELPICVTVTHLDGLVFGRSQFHHSANYRSVVAHGNARLITDEAEKLRVMTTLVEKVASGRSTDSRPPTRKELAETAIIALDLTEVSVKARVGGPIDEPEDYALPHWAGVVPLRLSPGRPEPDAGMTVPVPDYLRPNVSPWLTPEPMRGDHVLLEPLDMSHVDGLFEATQDDDVHRWLTHRRPADRDAMATIVTDALRMQDMGIRVPWVQREAATGTIVGTTSYYNVDSKNRCVAIGHTWLGKAAWRSGINTEAKLLLMGRAFDTLGAVRVEWHTDIFNERSQRAIERLGASREGIVRAHKLRPDGTWRDTVQYSMIAVEWPEAQARLREKLHSRVPEPAA